MKEITTEQTTDMILAACRAIIESKPYLTEVDSKIGDGDHGIGMAGGMEKRPPHCAKNAPSRMLTRFSKLQECQCSIPWAGPPA